MEEIRRKRQQERYNKTWHTCTCTFNLYTCYCSQQKQQQWEEELKAIEQEAQRQYEEQMNKVNVLCF